MKAVIGLENKASQALAKKCGLNETFMKREVARGVPGKLWFVNNPNAENKP